MENEKTTKSIPEENCFEMHEVELVARKMLDEYREAFLELAK